MNPLLRKMTTAEKAWLHNFNSLMRGHSGNGLREQLSLESRREIGSAAKRRYRRAKAAIHQEATPDRRPVLSEVLTFTGELPDASVDHDQESLRVEILDLIYG